MGQSGDELNLGPKDTHFMGYASALAEPKALRHTRKAKPCRQAIDRRAIRTGLTRLKMCNSWQRI